MVPFNCPDNADGSKFGLAFLHGNQLAIIELLAAEANDERVATIVLFQKRLRNLRIKSAEGG